MQPTLSFQFCLFFVSPISIPFHLPCSLPLHPQPPLLYTISFCLSSLPILSIKYSTNEILVSIKSANQLILPPDHAPPSLSTQCKRSSHPRDDWWLACWLCLKWRISCPWPPSIQGQDQVKMTRGWRWMTVLFSAHRIVLLQLLSSLLNHEPFFHKVCLIQSLSYTVR